MVNKPSTWTRGTNIANVAANANTRLGSGFTNALLLITAAATAT